MMHGRMGIFYRRANKGIPRPVLHSAVDDLGFCLLIRDEYYGQFEGLGFGLGLPIAHYWHRTHELVRARRYSEAIPLLNLAVKKFQKDPKRWTLLQVRGWAQIEQYHYCQAIRDLTKAITAQSDIPESYVLRANALAQLSNGLHREALLMAQADYEKAITLETKNPRVATNLNTVLASLARLDLQN